MIGIVIQQVNKVNGYDPAHIELNTGYARTETLLTTHCHVLARVHGIGYLIEDPNMKGNIKSQDAQDRQTGRKFSVQPPQNKSEATFMEPGKFYGCSQVILKSFYSRYGKEVDQMIMATGPLAAGVAQTRMAPCGALLGACMVMGMEKELGKMDNLNDKYGLYDFIQNSLFKKFIEEFGYISCSDLIHSRCTEEELKQKLHHERICRHSIRFVHNWLVNEMGIEPSEDNR